MSKTIRTFTKLDNRPMFQGETYQAEAYLAEDGAWRWSSNDAVVPLDAADEYGIPVDPVRQEAQRQADLDVFLAEYRRNHVPPSAEARAKMRAAFGEGTTVVDIITGERTRL
jgi:hypothetical protein